MSATTVRPARLASALATLQNDYHAEWCSEYGEPGYSNPEKGVILANWNDVPDRLQRVLERAGFELEWSDEWTIDYGYSKAYRTIADSYHWRPTAVLPPEWCEYLTPDGGADAAIEAFASDSAATVSAVPYWVTDEDLQAAGFVRHSERNRSGLHSGMTDDPRAIAKDLLKHGGPAARVVCRVDDNSQFYCEFSVWFEPVTADETDGAETV